MPNFLFQSASHSKQFLQIMRNYENGDLPKVLDGHYLILNGQFSYVCTVRNFWLIAMVG